MKKLLLMIMFAFLVQLVNGQKILIREAKGFVIGEGVHIFFDCKANPILKIPSEYIQGAAYLPEHEVM